MFNSPERDSQKIRSSFVSARSWPRDLGNAARDLQPYRKTVVSACSWPRDSGSAARE